MKDIEIRLEFDKVLERIAFYASFSLGKQKVLASHPSYSTLIVNRDLKRMKDALACVVSYGSFNFTGIGDVKAALIFSQKMGSLAIEDIIAIRRFASGVRQLQKQYNTLEIKYASLDDLFESLESHDALINAIDHVFGDGLHVLDRASKELSQIRSDIRNIEKTIETKTQDFLKNNASMLTEQVVSRQHGRQTFLLKPSEKNKISGTVYGTSASGQSVYFEPAFLSQFQNELNGLRHQEENEIERICLELSHKIALESEQLLSDLETAAILDALFAKAIWGQKNEGVVADLTQNTLELVEARHPLIDPKDVVSNTYTLSPPHKMVLISGPNTGGKSVSLKTIGLFVLMTHAGFPILAKTAKVMQVDQIFVDIGDQQSIEKNLSSFSAHLETVRNVSEHATSKSLILLDELGSQTDPLEGESLSMAILDQFREKGSWVVATTHFMRLKQYGQRYDDILVSSVEFDLTKLMPTYRYRENVMGESNAFAIAKRLGLDESIIDAAFNYKQESQYETDHMMEILENKIQEQEEIKESLAKKQLALDERILVLETQEKESQVALEKYKQELESQHESVLEDKLLEAEMLMEEMNKTNRPDLRKKAVQEIKKMQADKPIKQEIAIGDRVQLKSSQQIGIVEAIEKKTVFVSISGLKVSMDISKVLKVAGPAKIIKKKPQRSHSIQTLSSFKLEINLIGKRVSEALPLLDKYLDECLVHNVMSCRVIHGHGTGQLRTAVHQLLRTHKHVKSFELASMAEGGAGATLVQLK